MADEVLLNQNIQMLTQALTALNQNMFNHTGGRSNLWGANTAVPGTNSKPNSEDTNTIKSIATNTLLNATMKSNTDTVRYLIKDSKKNMQDLGKYTQMSAMFFKGAIKDFSVKQLDTVLPKKLSGYLEQHIAKGIVPQLKSFEDIVKLQKRVNIQNIDAAIKLAKEYGNATTTIARQTQIRENIEQRTGFNLNELGQAARDDGKALKQHAGEISRGMAEFAANTQRSQENWDKLKKAGEVLGAAALALGVDLYKTATAAQKYGTEVTLSTIAQAAYAGMTGEELIKVQNENIQAIHSSGMSFDSFNKKLDNGAEQLLAYTGNLKDGALVTANIFGIFKKLSNQESHRASFEANQVTLFQKMNRTLGVTAEQFIEMNNELTSNSVVQAEMYKVTSAQRINLIKGMQLQVQQLALDGLTVEQSKKLVQSLAEITGGKAKERYVEAAKIQGVLGALGLGKEGQRAAEIIRKGQRASPEELKELSQIQVEAQRSVSAKYANGSPAMEFQLDALTDVIGKFLGPTSPGAQIATSQGQAINQQTAEVIGQSKALDGLTSIGQTQILWAERQVQAINAGFSSMLPVAKGILGFLVADKIGGFLKNLTKLGGKAGARTIIGEGLAGTTGEIVGAGSLTAGAVAAVPIILTTLAAAATVGGIAYGLTKLSTATGADSLHRARASPEAQAKAVDAYRASKIKDEQQKNADIISNQLQSSDATKQITELTEQVKKLTDLQQRHLDESKKLTSVTQQGIAQTAAQTDDHINATRKIIEQRDTRHAPKIQ